MGKETKIGWTDATFSPWIGCVKISPGCQICYAETLMDKRMGRAQWGVHGTRSRTSDGYWQGPLKWNAEAEQTGRRKKVFCASLSDVFEDREDLVEWRAGLFRLIEQTPYLDWLLLTKRPENVMRMLPDRWLYACSSVEQSVDRIPSNVWMGVSAENQEYANRRIPWLVAMPFAVRFLSLEPLLGPVDLKETGALWTSVADDSIVRTLPDWRLIHWTIVGAESGRGARPMNEDWVRWLRDQCVEAGVPFFYKQAMVDGKIVHAPELDGRQWQEFPVMP